MPARALAAAPASAPSQHNLGRLAGDMVRHPGYYLSRLPRLPFLLHRHGVAGFMDRAFMVSVAAPPGHKRKYGIRTVLRSLLASVGFRQRSRRTARTP